jgi:hypothetical protein
MINILNEYVYSFLQSPLFTKYKLPLIAFSNDDVKYISILIDTIQSNNIAAPLYISHIDTEYNVSISSKHYPYTCNDIPNEHFQYLQNIDLYKYAESNPYINDATQLNDYSPISCLCKNSDYINYCNEPIPIYRSYKSFDFTNCIKLCKDECCKIINIPIRYLIYLK